MYATTLYKNLPKNIIHLTTGGKNDQYGGRTPGAWLFVNSLGRVMQIGSAINGKKDYKYEIKEIRKNTWIKVSISQVLVNGDYVYMIRIDGKEVHRTINEQAEIFQNVKIYASNPWDKPLDGKIRKLVIANRRKNYHYCVFRLIKLYNYVIITYLMNIYALQCRCSFYIKSKFDMALSTYVTFSLIFN